ncbi:hypothetical protein VTO73DRAFT_7981 [Trametes versicolor]
MSLLSSGSRFAARTANLPPELVVACLHTSAPLLYKSSREGSSRLRDGPSRPRDGSSRPRDSFSRSRDGSSRSRDSYSRPRENSSTTPSRTRLVKDLTPSSGKLEVAPSFQRDAAPHHDRPPREYKPRKPAPPRIFDSREGRQKFVVPAADVDLPVTLKLSGSSRSVDFTSGGKYKPPSSSSVSSYKAKVVNPLSEDFDLDKHAVPTSNLPDKFTSPPLMEGIVQSIHNILGPDAEPTPIQALSIKHLVKPESATPEEHAQYRQFLLASETGSGKSMAYLLPLLQDLKLAELRDTPRRSADPSLPHRAMNPRALVLAPTHELSRQLSGFAKDLLHNVKLRVMCASQANTPSRKKVTASRMADAMDGAAEGDADISSEIIMRPGAQNRPVDLLVSTPSKVLELFRGRGWDWEVRRFRKDTFSYGGEEGKINIPRKYNIGEPQMGLADIEWVVVDEADVLFDPDFQEATRSILAEISAARGHPVPFEPDLVLSTADKPTPIDYPFHLLLTSATIPASLAAYVNKFHPTLTRLASPNLHRLPSTLKTENFNWTGGNRDADIEHRLRRVWYEDLQQNKPLSRVLIFCNKSNRVLNLSETLNEKGIASVALTSAGESRKRGSNHHLDGFLRVRELEAPGSSSADAIEVKAEPEVKAEESAAEPRTMGEVKDVPHVMITTSLLSRGLDFSPDVKHVFIVDEPRNMVDFLHRAGRSGRAGEDGKVVVFGKQKGRGSEKARIVRRKVGALKA